MGELRIRRCYLDCETVGFHGLAVTIQYAWDDGEIVIHEVWKEPISATLELIAEICESEVIGFNLTFDWFHIQKLHNVLTAYVGDNKDRLNHWPEDIIDELGEIEIDARDGLCVKPKSALDLMLHFRKTEMQITMERNDVRIRRVPRKLAKPLAAQLTKTIQLDPILFAGQKKWAPRFQVFDVKDDEGNPHPELRDVVLKFRPGGGLKALATHLLGLDVTAFREIELDRKFRPKEYGYAPFARCIGRTGNWKWSWPDVVKYHIAHWSHREDARKYAEADVLYTRELHKFTGWIPGGDSDSVLSCTVASCRWKGYRVDVDKLDALITEYKSRLNAPIYSEHVKEWINEVLTPIEKAIAWREGTNKKALKGLIELFKEQNPKAAERAEQVLATRAAKKKIEVLEKLKFAGRFHASFKVIGALSGRMSGADKLNAQGIDKTKEVRGCFPLAFEDEDLLGGDMMSFEIGIAEADYGDPMLREKLTTCEECRSTCYVADGRIRCAKCIEKYDDPKNEKRCPKCALGLAVNEKGETRCNRCFGAECMSFHALFGEGFFPELGYEGIMASKGSKTSNVYNPVKNAAFATLYGAQPAKIATTVGVSEEQALEGFHRFWRTYAEAGRKRREIEWAFTSLYSPEGSPKIEYKQPEDAIESLLGYKRYFTLENYLIRELNSLATRIPKEWTKLKFKVTRSSRRGEQSAASAVRSALYGCAFGLQATCIRQAQNHRIQSTGAGITKELQVAVWNHQPSGIHKWMVRPMNIHDELQIPTDPTITEAVTASVYKRVEDFRPLVPLIGIDFGKLNSWSDK